MSGFIDIFLIEDHPIYKEGLIEAFRNKSKSKYRISGSAGSVQEARKAINDSPVGIILLDLKLPGESGVDFCAELKSLYPEKKVIALTGETDNEILLKTWVNNADAIVSKNSGIDELIYTIDVVKEGKRVLGSNVPLNFEYLNTGNEKSEPSLTRREEQVYKLLMTGMTKAQAAEKLFVSYETINTHVKKMFTKFDVHSFPALMLKLENYWKDK